MNQINCDLNASTDEQAAVRGDCDSTTDHFVVVPIYKKSPFILINFSKARHRYKRDNLNFTLPSSQAQATKCNIYSLRGFYEVHTMCSSS